MKDVQLWKPGALLFPLWGVVPVVIVWLLIFPFIHAGIPPGAAIGVVALIPVALLLHETAHLAACRLLGLEARFAERIQRIVPGSVVISGAVSWPTYAVTLAAPIALGAFLLLPGWMALQGLLPLPLQAAALALAWVGTVIITVAPDDAARIAALLWMRPPRVEESPDGRRFRSVGWTQWISVNPLADGPLAWRRAAIGAGFLMAALASLVLFS